MIAIFLYFLLIITITIFWYTNFYSKKANNVQVSLNYGGTFSIQSISIETLFFTGIIIHFFITILLGYTNFFTFIILTIDIVLFISLFFFIIYNKTPTFLKILKDQYNPKETKGYFKINNGLNRIAIVQKEVYFKKHDEFIYFLLTNSKKEKLIHALLKYLIEERVSFNVLLESINHNKEVIKKQLKRFYSILIYFFLVSLTFMFSFILKLGLSIEFFSFKGLNSSSEYTQLLHYTLSCYTPINKGGIIPLNDVSYIFDIIIILLFLSITIIMFQLLPEQIEGKVNNVYLGYSHPLSSRIRILNDLQLLLENNILDKKLISYISGSINDDEKKEVEKTIEEFNL